MKLRSLASLTLLLSVVAAAACASTSRAAHVPRLPPSVVWADLQRGDSLLLVCAYESKDCRGTHLQGSVTLEDLKARVPELSPDQRIVFFCG